MRSPSCLAASLSTSEPIGNFFNDIQYGGLAIEGDLEAIIFNAVAETIPK
jgi:hypothetical protein